MFLNTVGTISLDNKRPGSSQSSNAKQYMSNK